MAKKRETDRERGAPDERLPLFAAEAGPDSQPAEPTAEAAPDASPTERPPHRDGRRWPRITSTRIDRLLVIWIATALVVWLCCLITLWSWALDPSGATTTQALAATLLAIAAATFALRPLATVSRRVLQWLRLEDALAMDLTAEGGWVGREDLLAMTRLLGAVAVFSGLCGLVSTMAVHAGKAAVDWLTQRLLWTPLGWALLKLVVQFVGMGPIAVGIATAFRASSMVRSGSGQDPYAAVCREWLAGCGLAMVIFAGLWSVGVNLLGAALMTGVVLMAAAVVLFQRPKEKRRPRRVVAAAGWPGWGARGSVAAAYAGVGAVLAVQVRLVGDAAGGGPVGSALWLAASALLVVRFLRAEDRRSRPAGRAQAVGAAIGVAAAVVTQAVLAASGLALGREGGTLGGVLLLVLAAAAQVPTAALAAVILSRGRTLFARAGGSAKAYAACACGGAGAAVLLVLVVAGSAAGQIVLLGAGGGAMAACVAAGAYTARLVRRRIQWAACGAALICALAGGVIGSIRTAGPIALGTWLTSAGGPEGSGRIGGVIPWRGGWSQAVSDALTEILSRPGLQGRWWVVSPNGEGLGDPLPRPISVMASSPDPGAVPPGPWRRKVRAAEADFLVHTRIGRERLDGILLAPLAADHPQAWRCYNELVLTRCRQRLHRRDAKLRGALLLRTRAARTRVAKAVSVARTFHEVVGSGWAVLAFEGSRVDLLLAGPAEVVARPKGGRGAFVVDVERLLERAPGAGLVRLVQPQALWSAGSVDADELQTWLQSGRRK